MLSVDEALRLVLDHAQPVPAELMSAREALGRVLAETITSDVDSPPHDKAIVDGYALIAADAAGADAELTVIEEVTAGAVPTRTVERGTATRIMTGAPLPAGADAVVMVEQTTLAGERVRIHQSPLKPGQNIVRRGASLVRGQVVLRPGLPIRAIELGILAEVGRTSVSALRRPVVAVLPTGNELVQPSEVPGPGQIRNSNGPLLEALAETAGARAREFAIARDDPVQLRLLISSALGSDIVVLSGGVSAGVLDLVPQVLAELGVEPVFHMVNLKPGKPLWFGVRPIENRPPILVFGLPGNPVSSLVCFELFVRPAIEKLSGREPGGLPRVQAHLTREHRQRGERPTYWPALLQYEAMPPEGVAVGGEANHSGATFGAASAVVRFATHCHPATHSHPTVTPLAWQGSGDLRTLTDANCLAYFPPGERHFQVGDVIDVRLFA